MNIYINNPILKVSISYMFFFIGCAFFLFLYYGNHLIPGFIGIAFVGLSARMRLSVKSMPLKENKEKILLIISKMSFYVLVFLIVITALALLFGGMTIKDLIE